ncbi:MAG: hypothetical protein FJW32_02880 [Acidobacteria bacterium]|nr:hypothetical protein [Acidobacteriota bacterium]
MRLSINLASEPFRRDRAMAVASSVIAGLLVVTFGLLVYLIITERQQKRDVLEATAQAEAQLAIMSADQMQHEATMRKSENADVLERSVFLNSLIARKGVSWTRMFGDLESVLPHNVRLISIRQQTDPRNHVQLEMVVGSQSVEPVITLLKNLEESKMFGNPTMPTSLPPSQSEPLYRFRLSVNYAQQF